MGINPKTSTQGLENGRHGTERRGSGRGKSTTPPGVRSASRTGPNVGSVANIRNNRTLAAKAGNRPRRRRHNATFRKSRASTYCLVARLTPWFPAAKPSLPSPRNSSAYRRRARRHFRTPKIKTGMNILPRRRGRGLELVLLRHGHAWEPAVSDRK